MTKRNKTHKNKKGCGCGNILDIFKGGCSNCNMKGGCGCGNPTIKGGCGSCTTCGMKGGCGCGNPANLFKGGCGCDNPTIKGGRRRYNRKRTYKGGTTLIGQSSLNPAPIVNNLLNTYNYPQVDRMLLSTSGLKGGKMRNTMRKRRKSRRIGKKIRGGSSVLDDIRNIGGNFISNVQNMGSLYAGKVPEYSSNPTSQPGGSNFPHKPIASFNY